MTQKKSLYDFLVEAELSQYHKQFLDDLKVTTVSQVKYVTDVDLAEIGMTKPEIRRLNKFFKRHCNQGTLNKLKEILIRGQEELNASVSRPGAGKSQPPAAVETVEVDAGSIVIQGLIEEGEFGHVHQGTWKRDSSAKKQVAIKTIKRSLLTRSTSEFLQVMAEVQRLRHDNIICLFGVALMEDNILLVMELAPLRSLLRCISGQSSRASYPVWKLCDFSLQVANGMEFLEKKGLVHRDLSARNVLVFEGNLVKVSDVKLTQALGVGMEYYQRNVSFNLKLPVAWCAPECMTCEAFTSSSDVWAFGVTLWEMFSYGFQPWAGFTGKQIASAISPAEGSQRLNQPDSCPADFYQMMENCWLHSPQDRPTFSHIVTTLKEIKPIRMQVFGDRPSVRSDCLNCRANDVVTVLEKKPKNPPTEGMWKGVMESNGRVGFFDPRCSMPFIDSRTSEATPRNRVTRKASSRRSLRSEPPRLHPGMISAPQTDLRHLGHVGYDGAVFGDVAFIGSNYDRLPFKVKTPERDTADARMSTRSLTMNDLVPPGGRSFLSLNSDCLSSGTSFDISPGTSVSMSPGTSVFSPDVGVFDIPSQLKSDFASDHLNQHENSLDTSFDDFSIPDISGSMGLDFSILDEMMKSLGKLDEAEDDIETVQTRLSIREEERDTEEEEEEGEQKQSRVRSPSGTRSHRQKTGNDLDSSFPSVTWSDLARREKEKGAYSEHLKPSSLSKEFEIQECNNRSLSVEFRSNHSGRSLSDSFSPATSNYLEVNPIPKFTAPLDHSTGHHQRSPLPTIPQHGLCFDLHEPQLSTRSVKDAEESCADRNLSYRAARIEEGSGGVLSRIGSVLSRRTETRMKRSLQNQIPSSSSSSAEYLPSAERFPSRRQKNISSSLPRDGSLQSGETVVETRRPMSFLREGRSFGKTKARIKSSVSNVINGRSLSSKKEEPQTNLNVNLPFFDRLREQELEKVRKEELEARRLQCEEPQDGAHSSTNSAERDRNRPPDRDGAGRGDYVTRPLGLRTRVFESDSQTDEGIQISHSVSNMRNDFAAGSNRLPETHDSSHDSERSSMTHQSDDGVFADDSELDSPEGRVFRLDSRPSACCSVSQTNVGLGVTVAWRPVDVSRRTEDLELVGDRGERYDAQSAVLSCGQLDFYEDAMESVLDGPIFVGSSNLEETAASKVQQLVMSSAFENVQFESCACALGNNGLGNNGLGNNGWGIAEATKQMKVKLLVDLGLGTVKECQETLGVCDWNLDDAVTYLRANPKDQESPEYVHV